MREIKFVGCYHYMLRLSSLLCELSYTSSCHLMAVHDSAVLQCSSTIFECIVVVLYVVGVLQFTLKCSVIFLCNVDEIYYSAVL